MKLDFTHVDLSKGIVQIKEAFSILLSTPKFIIKHKLWNGFLDHKWVLIFSVVAACFFTLILYNDIHDYFIPDAAESIDIPTDDLVEEITDIETAVDGLPPEAQAQLQGASETLQNAKENLNENHKPLFSGSLKFLLLIFLEVFIFHFSVKTNNILKNENKILVFKDFFKAQKRMIFVMGRKWIYGLIMYILISIALSIAGLSFLRDGIMFLIYSFYLGFAFLDNYLEQFGFTINSSVRCIQTHFGASALLGVFASLLMYIPLIGPLITPFIFGIAATRYGHKSKMESFIFSQEKVKAG